MSQKNVPSVPPPPAGETPSESTTKAKSVPPPAPGQGAPAAPRYAPSFPRSQMMADFSETDDDDAPTMGPTPMPDLEVFHRGQVMAPAPPLQRTSAPPPQRT